ncbi:hypothetical protein I6A84_19045, partial [Frankia sp. CNm7]|nr:hypothetical protein [Frankia nepalensis]
TADGWTPLLLPVSLGAAGLAAAVLVAVVRPDRALVAVPLWAGAVLLAAAEPAAAACGADWSRRAARRWLRAAIAAVVLFTTVVMILLG